MFCQHRGATNAEIKVLTDKNREVSWVLPVKAGVGQKTAFGCLMYCQELSLFTFQHSRSFIFPPSITISKHGR